jgi:hypothetical protein
MAHAQVQLGRLVLKRFLLMVLLLDRAATDARLPPSVPLLFRRNAPHKSSVQVCFTNLT